MFYVFDLTSNETIATDTLQAHELQPTTTPSNQQHIKLRTILNTLKRSRTGCLQCRARKKNAMKSTPFVVHANAAKLIVVGELRLSLRFSKWTPRKFYFIGGNTRVKLYKSR